MEGMKSSWVGWFIFYVLTNFCVLLCNALFISFKDCKKILSNLKVVYCYHLRWYFDCSFWTKTRQTHLCKIPAPWWYWLALVLKTVVGNGKARRVDTPLESMHEYWVKVIMKATYLLFCAHSFYPLAAGGGAGDFRNFSVRRAGKFLAYRGGWPFRGGSKI